MSVGDTLAEARRQAGLSIAEVGQSTRIRDTIIRGIESDDFSECGGDFYARGHIRSIAKAVGVDPGAAIQQYDLEHGAPPEIRAAEVFEPSTPLRMKERRRSLNWSAAMIVALAVIISFAAYHAVSSGSNNNAKPVADQSSAPPTHSASPSPSPSPTATLTRELIIKVVITDEPCWIGFSTLTGGDLLQATLPAGSAKTWIFKHPVDMSIGNPSAVELTVNGRRRTGISSQVNSVTLPFRPIRQDVPASS